MPYVMCGNISVLYNMVFMHRGNTYFNLFKTPIFFEHLFATFSVCFFQFKFVSTIQCTINAKYLKKRDILSEKRECGMVLEELDFPPESGNVDT